MVMQVLVLAVQNSVDYHFLAVATSGSTLFRQIGGSIGVSIFGAIFANRLRLELATRLPAGAHVPSAANPAVLNSLPPAIHRPYVAALAVELHVPRERLGAVGAELGRRGLVATGGGDSLELSGEGEVAVGRLVEAGREELVGLLDSWQPEEQREAAPVLRRLASSLV